MIMLFGLSKSTSKLAPTILACVSALVVLLFLFTPHRFSAWSYVQGSSITVGEGLRPMTKPLPNGYASPRNKTLGFERIVAINMPHRWDRYDVVTLMAAASDLNITFSDGVYPKDTTNNSLPFRADWLKEPEVACFRAHANVWRQVIQEGWSSALIMESDADWDLAIKDQTALVAEHMQEVIAQMKSNYKNTFSEHDPYGASNWDMLIFGTCLETPREDMKFVSFQDPSIPPMSAIPDWGMGPLRSYYRQANDDELRKLPESSLRRFLHKSPGTVCTTSYAVSRRGAQRLLHILAVRGYFAQVDLGIRDLIWNNLIDAYTVLPPLMTQWRYMNVPHGDSDINTEKVTTEKRDLEKRAAPDVKGTFKSNDYFRKSTLMSLAEMLWPE